MHGKRDRNKTPRITEQAEAESDAQESACPREGIEAAFRCALELSEKDGSIVLSAGSMFVTAEVMTAWDKLTRES
jgi:hypothetical protein